MDTGANLLLWRPFDPSALAGSRTANGTDAPITSAIQTFLDLKRMAGRGEEAAATVYERLLVGGLRRAAVARSPWDIVMSDYRLTLRDLKVGALQSRRAPGWRGRLERTQDEPGFEGFVHREISCAMLAQCTGIW